MAIKTDLYRYLKNRNAEGLLRDLEKCGNIYLIGGVLREFTDQHSFRNLRDIDIVVDVYCESKWHQIKEKYTPEYNRFGGNKVVCQGLLIDFWDIRQTWAYREGVIPCLPEQYVSRLSETVFLNIDGIIYDWNNDRWHDNKYQEAMSRRVLDVVLKSNPQIPLNIVRAFILQDRYHMTLSDELKRIIQAEAKLHADLIEFVSILEYVQSNRYHKEIYSRHDFLQRLQSIL